ncbi:MAG: AMP-binding protein [Pseudonocardiales bacterium]|nr:AMP-binding protein [Pseudonocardiales bacterium]
MSNSRSAEQTAAVAAALAELGVRPEERVLIMLPDGPGFAAAFAATIQQHAVPVPVNPLLAAPEIATAATQAGAGLLLVSAEQIHTLPDLATQPPVLIDGPQGPWAAVLRWGSISDKSPRKRVVLLPHTQPEPTENTRPHHRGTSEMPPA